MWVSWTPWTFMTKRVTVSPGEGHLKKREMSTFRTTISLGRQRFLPQAQCLMEPCALRVSLNIFQSTSSAYEQVEPSNYPGKAFHAQRETHMQLRQPAFSRVGSTRCCKKLWDCHLWGHPRASRGWPGKLTNPTGRCGISLAGVHEIGPPERGWHTNLGSLKLFT